MNRIAIVDRPSGRPARPAPTAAGRRHRRRSRHPPTIPRRRPSRRRRSSRARRSAASRSPLPAERAQDRPHRDRLGRRGAALRRRAQDRLGPLRQDQGRQARRRRGDQAGQRLGREGPHRQRGARHRGRLGVDRRRGRAHLGRPRADPRRGRLPRRQGREGHALQGGAACCNFRRSGKSQVWRLAEGDNPCDGTREIFDLVYEKPVEKKPVPTQPKRG